MTAKILLARPLVELKIKELIKRCESIKSQGIVPAMSVVLVGENPASLSYIRNKRKICEEVGAEFNLQQLPSTTSKSEFLKIIDSLNSNPSTHGIIIQLPVSEELKKLDIPNLVDPKKDIDGFNGQNTQAIYAGTTDLNLLLPCTPKGIISLLQHYGIEISGRHIVVIGRSLIVGKPMSMLLSNFNATVTLAHSHTVNLEQLTRRADIVISAIGKPHFLTKKHFDSFRNTIVIDVGMNTLKEKLVGDVDYNSVKDCVGAISPVPGGVGPMTVVTLIENLITATENQERAKHV